MKYYLQIAAALLLSVTIFACKTSTSPSENTTTTSTSSMSATINGTAWTSQGVKGFRHAGQLNNLQFEGWTGLNTNSFIQMVIAFTPSVNQPGTYEVSNDRSYQGNYAVAVYNTMHGSYSDVIDGSVTVTSLTDKNIQGTFNFRAMDSDTVTVMNGKFNVPLD